MGSLPAAWQAAFERDKANGKPALADPLPERRLARLLGAFIASGLFFLVVPGTLLGVWNLLGISALRNAGAVPRIWIQAHGHAQLFGWVGTFILGISLYTVPKFRGSWIRSLRVGWLMLFLWDAALAARWASAIWQWHWRVLWPGAAAAELAVALLLIWQTSARRPSPRRRELWEILIFAGFLGFAATLLLQLALVLDLREPLIPAAADSMLLLLALWAFCFPVAWGFSSRFLPSFLGLARPDRKVAYAGLAVLGAGLAAAAGWPRLATVPIAMAAWAAAWSLGVFRPAERSPKVIGVDPRYPWFARASFGWLVVSALLAVAGDSAGLTGASRHAFTVGFLATLIFAIGPRILPSFLNSRELWSTRLMLVSLVALTAGCALRVASEPLAYAGVLPLGWAVLPVSGVVELAAVLLFALNLGMTLRSPIPVWIERRTVDETVSVYWCVSAYPETRRLLIRAGLATLERARAIPRTLTLREAADAEGIDWRPLVELLKDYSDRRLARALRTLARRPTPRH